MVNPSLFAGTEPKPGTQAHAVLSALKRGPVCSFDFYYRDGLSHRLAARIYDLRSGGWPIETAKCGRHDNHKSNAVEYSLT